MSETAKAPIDVFEKARTHDRLEQLEAAKEHDLLPYFRLLTSQAGPVVEMEGRETIMLGSNNYLGLTGDERVKGAAREALETYGTGVTGSRLLNGTTPLHLDLERELDHLVAGDRAGRALGVEDRRLGADRAGRWLGAPARGIEVDQQSTPGAAPDRHADPADRSLRRDGGENNTPEGDRNHD